MAAEATKVKITSPERVARILQRVAQGGVGIQIRSLAQIETAVKGRASSSGTLSTQDAFEISGVSDKGRAHLQSFMQSNNGVQIEFVLMAVKVVFFARIVKFSGSAVLVTIPDYLTTIERRRDERFVMPVGNKAFLRLEDWFPEIKDPVVPPFFEYQRELASLVALGDISLGGISIVSRFPALCKVLQKGAMLDKVSLLFPLSEPINSTIEIRWAKRLRESVQDFTGEPRTFRAYKFGIQFVNPSSKLQSEIQRFIAKIATSEAI
jgi:hypothetical protein